MQKLLDTNRLIYNPGKPYPLGATNNNGTINFAFFCKNASLVQLCIFQQNSNIASLEIDLAPRHNKTGNIWHISISNLIHKFHYGFRIRKTAHNPASDFNQIFMDPYAKAINSNIIWGEKSPSLYSKKDNTSLFGTTSVFASNNFDWEQDKHPNIPMKDLIIYEMHVRGFTQHESSMVKHKGKYLGLIEKIPYLKKLGINAIELLPIFEFNENSYQRSDPITKKRLYNYWGYSPVSFFAPMNRYATKKSFGTAITEFKEMVKQLHKNNIEIILDVVFNHTGESIKDKSYLSFTGQSYETYYITDQGSHTNYTGCGNTLNCNHPVVISLLIDSLRYWVSEMHVDGFRFDLASILVRGNDGSPLINPPIVEAMSKDPLLANTKLIIEPWDAAGLYHLGSFPHGYRFSEWNGKYRDAIRSFIKGSNERSNFATRICGSQDLYNSKAPTNSINFIISHDGFTLADLVSYNNKHNLSNAEDNNDGTNDNISWNCGIEGITTQNAILNLREKQMRNFIFALMISQGVPMIHMGDEYGHTKNGNNNTWCHDDEKNWFLWNNLEKNKNLFNFFKKVINFRKRHIILRLDRFMSDKDIIWYDSQNQSPIDWKLESGFLAFTLKDPKNLYDLFIAFNASIKPIKISLPINNDKKPWKRIMDTKLSPPHEFVYEQNAIPLQKATYHMDSFSSLLLKK